MTANFSTPFEPTKKLRVDKLLIKKRGDTCCPDRLILSFKVDYIDEKGNWVNYGIVKTGQLKSDNRDVMREITIDRPFTTSAIKLTVSEHVGYKHSRIGFVGQVTVEKESTELVGRAYVDSKFNGVNGGLYDKPTWSFEDVGTGGKGSTWDGNWAKPWLSSHTGFHRPKNGRPIRIIATFPEPVLVQKVLISKRGDVQNHRSYGQTPQKAALACMNADGTWFEWGEKETSLTVSHTHSNYIGEIPVEERTCLAVKVTPTQQDKNPSGRIGFIGRVE